MVGKSGTGPRRIFLETADFAYFPHTFVCKIRGYSETSVQPSRATGSLGIFHITLRISRKPATIKPLISNSEIVMFVSEALQPSSRMISSRVFGRSRMPSSFFSAIVRSLNFTRFLPPLAWALLPAPLRPRIFSTSNPSATNTSCAQVTGVAPLPMR